MPEQFVLVIEGGSRAGERVAMAGDRFTIGRKPGNSLVVQDASVSGNHCELLRTADGWLLRDLGSTNGTFVDGARISLPTNLRAGAKFALGTVVFLVGAGSVAPPAPSTSDEINLDEIGIDPPAATISPAAIAKPAAPAQPAASGNDLDFVEDEPSSHVASASGPSSSGPASTAHIPSPGSTVNLSPAAAAAMGIRTAGAPASFGPAGADDSVVTDAKTLDRAREAAAGEARRGRLLAVGGGIVVIGALSVAGWLVLGNDNSGGPALRTPPVVAGNLLTGSAASFEIDPENTKPSVRWQFRDLGFEIENDAQGAANGGGEQGESLVIGFTTSLTKAATGARSIEAAFKGPGMARATCDSVRVQSGQTVRFAAHALTTKDAVGAIQLVFRMKGEGARRVLRAGPRTSTPGAFQRIEGVCAVPPGCDQVSLSLTAAGGASGGSVYFDDAELLTGGEPAGTPPVVRREIEFDGDVIDGRVRRIERDLLYSMGLATMAAGRPAREWNLAREGEAFVAIGPAGKTGSVSLRLEGGDTAVTYHYKKEGGAELSLHWAADRAFANEFFVRGASATGRYRGEFKEAACRSIVFGEELLRLRATFEPETSVRTVVEGPVVKILVALPESLKITLQFGFEEEKRRAMDLDLQAEDAAKKGLPGPSIRLRSQILEEFPFERALVERNELKRDQEQAKGLKAAGEIDRRIKDAAFFKIPDAFRDARVMAQKLATAYEGTDVAELARASIVTIDRALAETEAALGERDASRLRTISRVFGAGKATQLSAYIESYLKTHYPNTAAATGGGN